MKVDPGFDAALRDAAAARHMTVSAYMRNVLAEDIARTDRRERLERALAAAAELPETRVDRAAAWR